MTAAGRFFAELAVLLPILFSVIPPAPGQGTAGPNVVILLRLAGDNRTVQPLQACLILKLSQMPDVQIVTAPINGERFILDIVVARGADDSIFASLVTAETFPLEQFRPRLNEGEDAAAVLTTIRYYTLLRLHEVVPGRSVRDVCTKITADISDKVLVEEYTERND